MAVMRTWVVGHVDANCERIVRGKRQSYRTLTYYVVRAVSEEVALKKVSKEFGGVPIKNDRVLERFRQNCPFFYEVKDVNYVISCEV